MTIMCLSRQLICRWKTGNVRKPEKAKCNLIFQGIALIKNSVQDYLAILTNLKSQKTTKIGMANIVTHNS